MQLWKLELWLSESAFSVSAHDLRLESEWVRDEVYLKQTFHLATLRTLNRFKSNWISAIAIGLVLAQLPSHGSLTRLRISLRLHWITGFSRYKDFHFVVRIVFTFRWEDLELRGQSLFLMIFFRFTKTIIDQLYRYREPSVWPATSIPGHCPWTHSGKYDWSNQKTIYALSQNWLSRHVAVFHNLDLQAYAPFRQQLTSVLRYRRSQSLYFWYAGYTVY